MGAVGGLLGLAGGEGGTGFSTPSGTNSGQLQNSYQNVQNALGTQQNLLGQFQNVAAGQGPNPAQAMLNQATGQNVANQASLMAGQRGAAQNVGLLARQAGQQGMQAQQQAAGQGASMQAQQQLGALNSLGQQTASITQAQQNEQNILQNANSANNQIHGQLANTTMQGQQGLIGGAMSGISSAIGLAKGGEVNKMAAGGMPSGYNTLAGASAAPMGSSAGPQSGFAQSLSQPSQFSSDNSGAQSLQQGASGMFKKKSPKDPMSGATSMQRSDDSEFGSSSIGNSGVSGLGEIGTMVGAKGGSVGAALKQGGHVPGKAKVKGNSYSNDTVKALLSPGEVVIPKSVMESKDPINGAAQFVQAVLAKKKGKK